MIDTSTDEIALDVPVEDSNKKQNLYQKLAEITLNLGYVQKLGEMIIQGHKVYYLRAIDILKEVREEMACRNVICVPSCEESVDQEVGKTTKGDAVIRTTQKFLFTFIDGDHPTERLPCSWYGYAQGQSQLAAYGGMTGAQRHFYSKFFNLLTDNEDPESWYKENPETNKWSADYEAASAKEREKQSAQVPGKRVGGPGRVPTKEDMEDSDPSNRSEALPPEPKASDESWRGFPLTAWQKLEERYPGKFVGSLTLEHLLRAHAVFVTNVIKHVQGFTRPDQKLLANAFLDRITWELHQGNIKEAIGPDNRQKYEIVKE